MTFLRLENEAIGYTTFISLQSATLAADGTMLVQALDIFSEKTCASQIPGDSGVDDKEAVD